MPISLENPFFSSDQTTDRILGVYHAIGNREAFRAWREQVPSDVRRIWLQCMLREAFAEKITTDVSFEDIQDLLPEQLRIELDSIRVRRRALETQLDEQVDISEDDEFGENTEAIEAELMGLDYRYERLFSDKLTGEVREEMMRRFAERYFTGFDQDPECVRTFFEDQTKEVTKLIRAFTDFLDAFQREDEQLLSVHRTERESVVPWSLYLDGAAIVGSSAIGPRDGTRYKKEQDLDILFFFHPDAPDPDAIKDALQEFRARLQERVAEGDRKLDLHVGCIARPEDWWPYLTGPHRIVSAGDPSRARRTHEAFVRAAVQKARDITASNMV